MGRHTYVTCVDCGREMHFTQFPNENLRKTGSGVCKSCIASHRRSIMRTDQMTPFIDYLTEKRK